MKKYRSSEARTSILSLRPRACREGSNLYNKKAFSLIELLVVMAIIAILLTIAILMFRNNTLRAQDVKTRSSVDDLAIALQLYEDDNSSYPVSMRTGESLNLFTDITNEGGPPYDELATGEHVYMKSDNQAFNNDFSLLHKYRSTDSKGTGYMILWELASSVTNAQTVTDLANLPVGKTNIQVNNLNLFITYGLTLDKATTAYFIYKTR